jgi:Smg protein
MKENVLDVLMYLFENYMYEEPDEDPDRDELQSSLLQAGFSHAEINKAFDWLEGLADARDEGELVAFSGGPIRVYSDFEQQRLDLECRGFLQFLENTGVLDSVRRELVIDRVMALESEDVDLEDLKWVVLMVLFNQPGQEANYAWMENLLFENQPEYRH